MTWYDDPQDAPDMTYAEYDALADAEGERALEREFEDAMAPPSAAPSIRLTAELLEARQQWEHRLRSKGLAVRLAEMVAFDAGFDAGWAAALRAAEAESWRWREVSAELRHALVVIRDSVPMDDRYLHLSREAMHKHGEWLAVLHADAARKEAGNE
jgi:hypothetical protein